MESIPSNLPTEGPTFRRVEVLSGVPRRRRWSESEKASIVAESLAPGAVARQVALRHGLHPNQLYMWRRELAGGGPDGSAVAGCGFVPVALSRAGAGKTGVPAGEIEIEVAGTVVRVAPGVDVRFLKAVLNAVKEA